MDIWLVPTGAIIDYPSNTLPAGYLLCDGSSYPTATYPNLFAVLGYYYGGSGANFNVPDCRSLCTIGAGQGAMVANLSNRVLGNFYGEENHALSQAEMPAHTHSYQYTGGTGATVAAGSNYTNVTPATSGSTGGSAAHNNTQASIAFNKIIKT